MVRKKTWCKKRKMWKTIISPTVRVYSIRPGYGYPPDRIIRLFEYGKEV